MEQVDMGCSECVDVWLWVWVSGCSSSVCVGDVRVCGREGRVNGENNCQHQDPRAVLT